MPRVRSLTFHNYKMYPKEIAQFSTNCGYNNNMGNNVKNVLHGNTFVRRIFISIIIKTGVVARLCGDFLSLSRVKIVLTYTVFLYVKNIVFARVSHCFGWRVVGSNTNSYDVLYWIRKKNFNHIMRVCKDRSDSTNRKCFKGNESKKIIVISFITLCRMYESKKSLIDKSWRLF